MSVIWQELATLLIVGAACAYLARKWFWPKRGSTASCSTCSSCTTDSPAEETLVPIESLRLTPKAPRDKKSTSEV